MLTKHKTGHGRLYMASERMFDLMLAGYRKSLDAALRHRALTLGVFLLTVCISGYLFVIIPKGFFPQQDTGLILGTSEAAQDVSFAEMQRSSLALCHHPRAARRQTTAQAGCR
jgi:multidrug efflux pump subunit AcrB